MAAGEQQWYGTALQGKVMARREFERVTIATAASPTVPHPTEPTHFKERRGSHGPGLAWPGPLPVAHSIRMTCVSQTQHFMIH